MMTNELTPILIGFKLEEIVNTEVVRMNQDLGSSKIDFNFAIPHVTLWMGFVKSKQIESLNLGLNKIFQNVSIINEVIDLAEFGSQFGKVWSLELKLSRELYLLQNRIHHFFEPFREKGLKYKDLDKITIEYINNFASKSLDNYSPHLTIGFGGKLDLSTVIPRLLLSDPKMFEVGNYCTCIKQIQ